MRNSIEFRVEAGIHLGLKMIKTASFTSSKIMKIIKREINGKKTVFCLISTVHQIFFKAMVNGREHTKNAFTRVVGRQRQNEKKSDKK